MPAAPAHADPAPGPYAADAHGDLVALRAKILGNTLANTFVGHAQTRTDSNGGLPAVEGGAPVPAAARVHAVSSNVDVQLLGDRPTVQTDLTEATAPEPSDPARKTLLPVNLSPLADVGVIAGDVRANGASTESCPGVSDGIRPVGAARTDLAGATVLGLPSLPGLPGLDSVASVGASFVETRTDLVDTAADGDTVRSAAELTIGDVSLLGGLVVVKVGDPVVITAESDGVTAPRTSSSNTTAQVLVGGKQVAELTPDGASVPIPVDLGLATVDLDLTLFQPTPVITGRTASLGLDAVLAVDLDVTLLGQSLVDLHLGVGQLAVSATAPEGGVRCAPVALPDADQDGLTDAEESDLGTDPHKADTDNDGLTDGEEVKQHHTDPLDPDTDKGGVTDGAEVDNGTDPVDNPADDLPARTDSDGDGLTDAEEATLGTDPHKADTDGDGLSDGAEVHTHGTDPKKADTDGGGVADGAELDNGTDPVDKPGDDLAATGDTDGDGLSDAEEADLGTDPAKADTDKDGLSDGREVHTVGTDPLDPDTDDGGVLDGVEVQNGTDPRDASDDVPTPGNPDRDGDGLTDSEEAELGTDPTKADTDGDGLRDGAEVHPVRTCATNPLRADTDGDRLTDGREVKGITIKRLVFTNSGVPKRGRSIGLVHTNPCARDTDRDGLSDQAEVVGARLNQVVVRYAKNGGRYTITTRQTNPTRKDTDGDGLTDRQEVTGSANTKHHRRKSDPTVADTDWGGAPDGVEVRNDTDPTRAG